jgi:hypothetical protein
VGNNQYLGHVDINGAIIEPSGNTLFPMALYDAAGNPITSVGGAISVFVSNDIVANDGDQTTQIVSSSTETTIVTANAAAHNDITGLQITNQSATIPVTVTIKDGTAGTTRKVFDLAAGGGIVVSFPNKLMRQSAINANWTATLSVATVTVDVNVDYSRR